MSEVTWLFVAFLAAWAAIAAYLFTLATRQRKLEERVRDLDRSERG